MKLLIRNVEAREGTGAVVARRPISVARGDLGFDLVFEYVWTWERSRESLTS